MADNPFNAVNRGVYISDNLPFLQSLNDECIDLVCIDPPFAKNETFGRKNSKAPDPLKPPLSDEEKATEIALLRRWGIANEADAANAGIDWPATRYKDFWSWQDVHESWLKNIEDHYPGVHKLIETTQEIHGDGTAAYLCYMAVRLFEIHRALKDTGSLYLHCDHTAGAYLRQLLDAVFRQTNFRNEITWRRHTSVHGSFQHEPKQWGTITDNILFYAKSPATPIQPYRSLSEKEAIQKFNLVDENGERYYDDSAHIWNSPNMGERPNQCYEWKGFKNPHPSGWRLIEKRLEEEYGKGNIVILPNGKLQRRKYQGEFRGTPTGNLWDDIDPTSGEERTGYPTQKPITLAERIIKASCPEGGVVIDCFAGCAYVAVAAERLGRNWVACDINPRAWTVFKRQFSKPRLALLTCAEPTQNLQKVLLGNTATVRGPHELPTRETPIADSTPPAFKLTDRPRRFKTPASIIPEPEMLEILLRISGYIAWCCGFANRMPDGSVLKTTRNFHLDHLNPVSKAGTSHQITNRAPLCPYHNIKKSNHRLHLAEYREKIQEDDEMMVNDTSELINLDYAFDRTLNIYSSPNTAARTTHLVNNGLSASGACRTENAKA